MMTENADKKREQIHLLCMDEMVPKDHLLRIIDKAIDWTFIYDLVKDKYSHDTGRPGMDPVTLIKIPLIQYLYGIKSMRQTVKEIEVNVAYRWFLGLDMTDKVPHFSTFGKNYTRRFKDTDLFEQIFAHILEECYKFKLVDPTEIFAYAVETACDKNGWILGYTVSPGNLHDSRTFKGLYDKIKNIGIKTLVADAGYKTPAIAKLLIDDGVTPLFPYKRPMTKEGFFKKYEYAYDEYYDCYICPNNQVLKYSTTNRDGYREYKSCGNVCENCSYLSQCTESKNHVKLITRHIWENYMEQCEDVRHTLGMKKLYEQRKETIERIFGTAKENHGFRYTQMYGKARMEMKVGLTFACMNLKKLAMMLQKSGRKGCLISTFLSFWANDCCKQRKVVLGQQS
ncbi:putative uncharacterized protein [Roseburia sp. CAG:309]|nr:putative uncharacterized protein [Roseburia sp. CAG:309]